MDSFYLNLAVYLLQDFLKTTDSGAPFEYGRPMKPHGWNPMTVPEMVKVMAASMEKGMAAGAVPQFTGRPGDVVTRACRAARGRPLYSRFGPWTSSISLRDVPATLGNYSYPCMSDFWLFGPEQKGFAFLWRSTKDFFR